MNEKIDIDPRDATPLDPSWFERQGEGTGLAAAARPKASRVALLAHCGTGNLGDEASIASVLDNIRRRAPGVSIVGVTMDPDDTRRRHGAVRQGALDASAASGRSAL